MALHNTLETNELLERILNELTPFDILHARRVSKHFYDLIRVSIQLSKKLFIRVSPKDQPKLWLIDRENRAIITDFREQPPPPAPTPDQWLLRFPCTINEMMFERVISANPTGDFYMQIKENNKLKYKMDLHIHQHNASFKDMFLTFPPAKIVTCVWATKPSRHWPGLMVVHSNARQYEHRQLRNERGVRMWEILRSYVQTRLNGPWIDMERSYVIVENAAVVTKEEKQMVEQEGIWLAPL